MSRGTFWAERVWTGAPTPQARGLRSGADMALAVPGAGPIEAPAAGGGELARSVLIEVAGGRIVRLTPGVPAPPEAVRLGGLVLPGLVNAHSHVF